MHTQILTEEQIKLLPLIKLFNKKFYLVGGTAIALHIGHRRSIDFDLFNLKRINRKNIKELITNNGFNIDKYIVQKEDEFTLIINKVKFTFYNYPYVIPHSILFKDIISMPNLLDLACMKAYALGRRAKWKDYVDLFYILKNFHTLSEISARATEIFEWQFVEKLFRQQLCFFQDIDYVEQIDYLIKPVSEEEIKNFLTEIALTPF